MVTNVGMLNKSMPVKWFQKTLIAITCSPELKALFIAEVKMKL